MNKMVPMKHWIRHNRGFLLFVVLLGLFRTAVADWNPIPSGSMHPALLEGDVVFVDRLAYNVKIPLTDIVLARTGDPHRGDIVTFFSPKDGRRLIKRVIGLPGDVVEMRHKKLVINGHPASYAAGRPGSDRVGPGQVVGTETATETIGDDRQTVQWMPVVSIESDFGPVTVPADHFLMLGDNRDDSADSRYFGFVPRRLLIGRAERVLVSADILDKWEPRFDRFGAQLH